MRVLRAHYERNTAATTLARIDRLLDAKYNDGDEMTAHLAAVTKIVTEIRMAVGIDLEKLQIVALLRSLPNNVNWAGTVDSLKTLDEGALTLEKVTHVLQEKAEETVTKKKQKPSESTKNSYGLRNE